MNAAQHEDHIELQVEQRDTGLTRRLRARYVVGADGASSFVRQAAAIDWVDLGYQSEELVIDYRPHDPEAEIAGMPDLALVFDPAQPLFLMRRLGWKHARWEFHLLPGQDPEEAQQADRCWERLAPWVTPADGELIRHFVYPFQSLVAADWRRGRALLVGDAAHVMPPTMGQACAPASATRPPWPGSWTWCCGAWLRTACSTPTAPSALRVFDVELLEPLFQQVRDLLWRQGGQEGQRGDERGVLGGRDGDQVGEPVAGLGPPGARHLVDGPLWQSAGALGLYRLDQPPLSQGLHHRIQGAVVELDAALHQPLAQRALRRGQPCCTRPVGWHLTRRTSARTLVGSSGQPTR